MNSDFHLHNCNHFSPALWTKEHIQQHTVNCCTNHCPSRCWAGVRPLGCYMLLTLTDWMSLPAPSPLNSNFTLIHDTKINASLKTVSSLKVMPDYLHQSRSQSKWWCTMTEMYSWAYCHWLKYFSFYFILWNNRVLLRKIQVFKRYEMLHVSTAGIANWLRDTIMFWVYNVPQFYHVIYSRCRRSFCEVSKHVKMCFHCNCLFLLRASIKVVWFLSFSSQDKQRKDNNQHKFIHPPVQFLIYVLECGTKKVSSPSSPWL